ncbi:MAG: RluA family pseudouridine synthase [Firmicutes bacterium]|nr:RluA family pseudouridine synthase [Bacillota bacterium]
MVCERQNERVDRFLAEEGEWSRSFVQSLIERGLVMCDESPVLTNSLKVQQGQVYTVTLPEVQPLQAQPEDLPLTVVYEDDDLLVVDKPRGMVAHPAPGHTTGTLVGAVLYHLGARASLPGNVIRPGIVHRIDKDTSGLLMIAKSDLAMHSLGAQLQDHSVSRVYKAIVHGGPAHERGVIDAPLGRDPHNRQLMAVVSERHGKRAVTRFVVCERFTHFSLLELRLETGRTHQIRVHMAYIGHPVAGDPLYARRDPLALGGQALHAAVLGFTHPRTKERLLFESELPAYFTQTLEKLRQS